MSTDEEYLDEWVVKTLVEHIDVGIIIDSIVAYIDYKDHSRWTAEEVTASLHRLRQKGEAIERDGEWYSTETDPLDD